MTDDAMKMKLINSFETGRVVETPPMRRRGKGVDRDPIVLDALLAQLTPETFPEAVDFDRPAGQEVW